MDRFYNESNGKHGYEPQSRRSSRGKSYGLSNSSSISDDCDYKGSSVKSYGRKVNRDIVRCETPPPVFKRIVERAPTPEPEVIERVVVRPAPQTIVERVIERPQTPPPRIVEREVAESPQPTIVRTRVIKVDSRGNCNYNRGYIHPSSDSRVSRYDDYWDKSKYRSQSNYRSRPCSHYSRSISRSTSRHSNHPTVHLSRSQSFDVIHIPAQSGRSHIHSVYSNHHEGEGHRHPQYCSDKYQNNIIGPSSQGPSSIYPTPQNMYPNNIQGMHHQYQQQHHHFPQHHQLQHHISSHQEPSGYDQIQHVNMTPIGYQYGRSHTGQMTLYPPPNMPVHQPNVINLQPISLTQEHMQYMGIPYPSF